MEFLKQHIKGEIISNLAQVNKKDRVNRPEINLKNLKKLIPYQHLKMEGLNCPKNILKKLDCMYKLDLKDAYSPIALNPSSTTFAQFLWWGKLYAGYTTLNKYSNYCISRQHVIYWPNITESLHVQRHCNLPISISCFCFQSKEISLNSHTENRVSKGASRFNFNDLVFTKR